MPCAQNPPAQAKPSVGHPLGASGARILGSARPRAEARAAAATASPRSASASARAWPSCWRRVTSTTTLRPATSASPRRAPAAGLSAGYKSTRLRHPKQPLISPAADASPRSRAPQLGPDARSARSTTTSRASTRASRSASGSSSRGRVLDTEGKPLRDTLVEIWQANAAGRYRHRWRPAGRRRWTRTSRGAGRCLTDDEGRYRVHHDQARRRTRGATTTTRGAPRTSTSRCSGAPSRSAWSRRCTSRATRCSPYDPIFNSVARPEARASA